jgi:hypothetical protein
MTTIILLTGQYGTSHAEVSAHLRWLASERLHHLTSLHPIACSYSVEDEIWDLTGGPEAFFELPNDSERDDIWNEAFVRVRAKIDRESPVFAFVSLHVVYLWKKRFFSSVDWDRLLTIQPRAIVTLIDDVYDISTRIAEGQERDGVRVPGGGYPLQEILAWRLREIHTSSLIAKHLRVNPEGFPSIDRFLADSNRNSRHIERRELELVFGKPCDHFVIAVKQDAEDLYRLLFDRKMLRIYASYPISAPRRKNDLAFLQGLREWRSRLHGQYVVFDPVGIDEARFVETDGVITGRQLTARIPYEIGTPMVKLPKQQQEEWPLEELRAIRDTVIQQIGERDYKLVSQANVVLMWRPLYEKQRHDGVDSEGVFAAAKRIPVHSYHPAPDLVPNKPFPPHYGTPHATEVEVLQMAEAIQKDRNGIQVAETY